MIAGLAMGLYAAGALRDLDLRAVDASFSLRGPQSPGSDIVIVAVDQKTLSALNVQPPIPRSAYGQLLDVLRPASPRLIAIDTQFIGRSAPLEDGSLFASLARDGPVLLATHEGDQGPLPVPAGVENAPGVAVASASVDKDPDGVVRRMLFAPVGLKTFAVRAAELFGGRSVDPSKFPGNHGWIDYRGPAGTFPRWSLIDVVEGRVAPSAFSGKAVLVGVTDPVEDVFATPVSSMPMSGVEVHANALWSVLRGMPLRPAGGLANILIILVLAGVPSLAFVRWSAPRALGVSVLVLFAFLVAAQLAFLGGHIVSVAYPVTGLVATAIGATGVDSYLERRQRWALERALGELLPPQSPAAFFVSYRRSQNAWQARDIKRELAAQFGSSSVFMDLASIDYGEAFPARITDAIRGCSVMLVLIGPKWLEEVDGTRRIDAADDWVRREIEAGLQRPEAVVVPVLLDNARCPTEAELPGSIRALAGLHAVSLTGDRLDQEIERLVKSIDRGRNRASQGVTVSRA